MFSDNFVNIMEEKPPASLNPFKKWIKRIVKVMYAYEQTSKHELIPVVGELVKHLDSDIFSLNC